MEVAHAAAFRDWPTEVMEQRLGCHEQRQGLHPVYDCFELEDGRLELRKVDSPLWATIRNEISIRTGF